MDTDDKAAGGVSRSWLGSIADEEGGAGVWFDDPHDDVTAVDVRRLKSVVVMATELLCHQRKWEKLVDIGLRFDAVTRSVLPNHQPGSVVWWLGRWTCDSVVVSSIPRRCG